MVGDWQSVEDGVARIIADNSKTFDDDAIAQIGDVMRFIRGRTPVPEVGPGYWRTSLCISWPRLSIEVFADRLEVYRFRDKSTAIQHFPHVPGTPFPEELVKTFDELRA